MEKYYLDTSIWLDLFEDRNEQNLPKGEYAKNLIEKIVSENNLIVLSDMVRGVPRLDAVHALIARDAKALIISRDAHFRQLKDIARCAKPEELI